MGLNKSKGNMYGWVTHTHTHLAGKCHHGCTYCYVQRGYSKISGRYIGPVRLDEKQFDVSYGTGKIIFIEHMNDIFEASIPLEWIARIMNHCNKYPENEYVFQSKDTNRAFIFERLFPEKFIIGTTIESNRAYPNITYAPPAGQRIEGLKNFTGNKKFITIEPILDFDPQLLADMIVSVRPDFVNIGADSKGIGLPEPPKDKILELIDILKLEKVIIRKKVNLERLIGKLV